MRRWLDGPQSSNNNWGEFAARTFDRSGVFFWSLWEGFGVKLPKKAGIVDKFAGISLACRREAVTA